MAVQVTKYRFDVDDYHRMVEAGILDERSRVELIDGEVVAMTPIGPRHNAAVTRANRALVTAAGNDALVRPQGSVRLDRFHEPQPDFALLRPQPDFYASRLPGPEDILLVIEIADSSLPYDRDVKSRIYARLGVREYWLADLDDRTVWCFSDPGGDAYRTSVRRRRGESIVPAALPQCTIG
jgi:Uma2 family endonuclease